jgi:hypothetical protein
MHFMLQMWVRKVERSIISNGPEFRLCLHTYMHSNLLNVSYFLLLGKLDAQWHFNF